jgi:hypothetical protein
LAQAAGQAKKRPASSLAIEAITLRAKPRGWSYSNGGKPRWGHFANNPKRNASRESNCTRQRCHAASSRSTFSCGKREARSVGAASGWTGQCAILTFDAVAFGAKPPGW